MSGARVWLLCISLSLGACATSFGIDRQATRHVGTQSDTLDSIKRLPDWSGAWGLDRDSFKELREAAAAPVGNPNVPLLTPAFEAIRKRNNIDNGGQGPDGNGVPTNSATCLPDGMPLIQTAAYAHEYLFTPGRVTIIVENNEIRRIYTDGRAHPKNIDPTFEGHSIGHWEGDTLVVDTVGLKSKAMLVVGLWVTPKTHIVERIRRQDKQTMLIDTTVDDPDMLLQPYHYTRTYKLSDAGMVEYFCTENNRDSNRDIDLTPPPL